MAKSWAWIAEYEKQRGKGASVPYARVLADKKIKKRKKKTIKRNIGFSFGL